MTTVLRWIFFFVMIGLCAGVWMMAWIGFAVIRKLDRDQGDRDLLRAHLMHESALARTKVDALNPDAIGDPNHKP